MKLFTKIFFLTVAVMALALSATGYLIISQSFDNSLSRECKQCIEEYQVLKYTLQSAMLSADENGGVTKEGMANLSEQTAEASKARTAVFTSDLSQVYSGIPEACDLSLVTDIVDGTLEYETQFADGAYWTIVAGKFMQGSQTFYFATAKDVTQVISEKQQMLKSFRIIYIIVMLLSAAVMLVLSLYLTQPIKRLTYATRRFSRGDYAQRAVIRSRDETAELSASFNRMAKRISDTILELEENARRQEDFVSNFAHELKTPLTSVIGYADMIYQKDLTRAQVKAAAGYILNEGMRLEALSLKLMELIVLEKQDFTLMYMNVGDVFSDITDTLRPLMVSRGVTFEKCCEDAQIKIEFDLFKTLLLNLIDNAVKADATKITLKGWTQGDQYMICVSDNGRGIPQGEIARVTEAFYMVDKSRSRAQHGAGLGLALVTKIAQLHSARLDIGSKVGKGTEVCITLRTEKP